MNIRIITDGLAFPEGPVLLEDGSVVVTEIARGTLTRIDPDSGRREVLAECGGGPNGAALAPDGSLVVTNNGGYFSWLEADGVLLPGPRAEGHVGGSLQRVDPATGRVETLLDSCEGERLVAPNDLVVDADGGIWFTDFGAEGDRPGVLYVAPDSGVAVPVVRGTHQANGIGRSGDDLYVAETHDGRLRAWRVVEAGVVDDERVLHVAEGSLFDSLAVDGRGWVCVATIGAEPGITAVAPDGSAHELIATPDPVTTNVCFAGSSAYVTLSSSGRLAELSPWPGPS